VAQAHPDIARQGVLLRKYGQEIIRATAGKRVHGTGSVPGGMNRHLSAEDQAMLLPRPTRWCNGPRAPCSWCSACTPRTRRCTTASPAARPT
jgi:hypothetical protein